MSDVAVLVPAWKPGPELRDIVMGLRAAGVPAVIVIDDGSGAEYSATFAELAQIDGVRLVRHAINLGKGRALKTGFNLFLTEYSNMRGLATADADGQHDVRDIVRAIDAFEQSDSAAFVLGVRRFDATVPFRSRVGNAVTSVVFRYLTGRRVTDTQTGLRVFSRALLASVLPLEGERYEYEMTVLSHVCRSQGPLEIEIATIYANGNASSHFHPIRDSARIYFVLLRFYASSLLAAGIDTIVFVIAYLLTNSVPLSFVAGRSSSLVNFALNKRFVFHSETSIGSALARYLVLVVAIALAGYASITFLTGRLHWNVFAAKILVESGLSLLSFAAQRTFVFGTRERESL